LYHVPYPFLVTSYTYFRRFRPNHFSLFFFNATAPTDLSTLSLHDALPISLDPGSASGWVEQLETIVRMGFDRRVGNEAHPHDGLDRKSTRLNSSHVAISYAVFCLKKKKPTSYDCDHISGASAPRRSTTAWC